MTSSSSELPIWIEALDADERPLAEALHALVVAGEAEWVE